MMITANMIKQIIKFDNSKTGTPLDKDNDAFYQIQLIKHQTMEESCSIFKKYYINKLSDLDKYYDEIITTCDTFNLKAYFEINRKSYKKVALNSLFGPSHRSTTNYKMQMLVC